jgi:hypothetical protein
VSLPLARGFARIIVCCVWFVRKSAAVRPIVPVYLSASLNVRTLRATTAGTDDPPPPPTPPATHPHTPIPPSPPIRRDDAAFPPRAAVTASGATAAARHHDVVLASDPLYADDITAALLAALRRVTAPEHGLAGVPVLLLYKFRYPSRDVPYFVALAEDFVVELLGLEGEAEGLAGAGAGTKAEWGWDGSGSDAHASFGVELPALVLAARHRVFLFRLMRRQGAVDSR